MNKAHHRFAHLRSAYGCWYLAATSGWQCFAVVCVCHVRSLQVLDLSDGATKHDNRILYFARTTSVDPTEQDNMPGVSFANKGPATGGSWLRAGYTTPGVGGSARLATPAQTPHRDFNRSQSANASHATPSAASASMQDMTARMPGSVAPTTGGKIRTSTSTAMELSWHAGPIPEDLQTPPRYAADATPRGALAGDDHFGRRTTGGIQPTLSFDQVDFAAAAAQRAQQRAEAAPVIVVRFATPAPAARAAGPSVRVTVQPVAARYPGALIAALGVAMRTMRAPASLSQELKRCVAELPSHRAQLDHKLAMMGSKPAVLQVRSHMHARSHPCKPHKVSSMQPYTQRRHACFVLLPSSLTCLRLF